MFKKKIGFLAGGFSIVVFVELVFRLFIYIKFNLLASLVLILFVISPLIVNVSLLFVFKKSLDHNNLLLITLMGIVLDYYYIYLRLDVILSLIISTINITF